MQFFSQKLKVRASNTYESPHFWFQWNRKGRLGWVPPGNHIFLQDSEPPGENLNFQHPETPKNRFSRLLPNFSTHASSCTWTNLRKHSKIRVSELSFYCAIKLRRSPSNPSVRRRCLNSKFQKSKVWIFQIHAKWTPRSSVVAYRSRRTTFQGFWIASLRSHDHNLRKWIEIVSFQLGEERRKPRLPLHVKKSVKTLKNTRFRVVRSLCN